MGRNCGNCNTENPVLNSCCRQCGEFLDKPGWVTRGGYYSRSSEMGGGILRKNLLFRPGYIYPPITVPDSVSISGYYIVYISADGLAIGDLRPLLSATEHEPTIRSTTVGLCDNNRGLIVRPFYFYVDNSRLRAIHLAEAVKRGSGNDLNILDTGELRGDTSLMLTGREVYDGLEIKKNIYSVSREYFVDVDIKRYGYKSTLSPPHIKLNITDNIKWVSSPVSADDGVYFLGYNPDISDCVLIRYAYSRKELEYLENETTILPGSSGGGETKIGNPVYFNGRFFFEMREESKIAILEVSVSDGKVKKERVIASNVLNPTRASLPAMRVPVVSTSNVITVPRDYFSLSQESQLRSTSEKPIKDAIALGDTIYVLTDDSINSLSDYASNTISSDNTLVEFTPGAYSRMSGVDAGDHALIIGDEVCHRYIALYETGRIALLFETD